MRDGPRVDTKHQIFPLGIFRTYETAWFKRILR
jgi:hypothetical protein